MAFGFGRESGPRGPFSGQAPFNSNPPRPLSPQPPTLPFPDSSGAPRFPTPSRTFEAVIRSSSPVTTPHVAPGSLQPYVPSSRDSSLQLGARQSSISGGSGNQSQRNYFSHRPETSISPKVFPSQNSESSRRLPVQYTEDFLNEPVNDDMEGHADTTINHREPSQRRQSPFSAVPSKHSIVNSTASLNASQRPSGSPPKFSSRSGAASESQYSQRMSSPADGRNGDATVTRLPSHSLTKRSRSPPAAGQAFQSSSPLTEDDTEREEQAKAKRLARFKTELEEVEPTIVAQNKKGFLMKSTETKNSMEDLSQDYDNEDSQLCSIIVGVCPDMCPASERGERERKGDLDRYERLDGDRNHTNKILAVKKYNRTAEREAELIRPMPILQKTMDYLLGLLDQPYDDRLLALYNFLWDRMRAIRMDLRMQHIFNIEAITMLEQMIRLHVIAMHELCDFSKGEGFSEGFDAHLNIEQMNKTSVELFQLYDDHRKKGIVIPTEKEFRGYYALLKLDKHPGYKVEPAELSLDLAKMTAEMRQTEEILFARDVARSCRTGNFIAFFRNARKASYLQACLMHAHFSKLRTQALASLHSGLQYNQGVPITHIAKWLGMEGEDIESLLEYHGFSIKEFEEPYMVKSGPFLHDDKDYPTRCSTLVDTKKSNTIVEDVLASHEIILASKAKPLEEDKNKRASYQHLPTKSPLNVSVGGDMEIEAVSSLRGSMQVQPVFDMSSGMQTGVPPGSNFGKPFSDHRRGSEGSPRSNNAATKAVTILRSDSIQERSSLFTPKSSSIVLGDDRQSDTISPRRLSSDQFVFAPQTSSLGLAKPEESRRPTQSSQNLIEQSEFNATPAPPVSLDVRELMACDSKVASISATSPKNVAFMEELAAGKLMNVQEEMENDDVECNFDKEVAEAKLRLLLRLWMRRFVRKKKLYEENRLAANAALSSLSLGPPLWQIKDKPLHSPNLNVDKAVHERHKKWQESRVRWNISDLVASKLAEKNPNSTCVCWKVLFFSWLHHETHDIEARLDGWLHHKLIAAETTNGLAMSGPELSVWRKWAPNNYGDTVCYFSVVKGTTSRNSQANLAGASAVLFPISETVPWDVQRTNLHKLTMSLPINACIPLLIINGFTREDVTDYPDGIVAKLGLEELDKTRVGSYSVICLNEGNDSGRFHGYFSDQRLKDGLIWLASESRPQPVLSCMTTRELVSLHLNSCLDALRRPSSVRVGPNECISAFNEALDQTINDVVTAAKANSSGWPCPELFLLDESTSEYRAVKKFLPSLGWSSSEEVEPLISALRNCKLPYFSDDLSWLGKGCTVEAEIEEQRQLLQDCLMKYLTQTCNMMHWMMAAKEATLMIQNFTKLELCDTDFQMFPSWILICRRVFNWQLNGAESFTRKAYILEQTKFDCTRQFLKPDLDVHMNHLRVHPSLDEMVEVSCSRIVSKRVRSSPKSSRNVVARTSRENIAAVTLPSHGFEEKNFIQNQYVDDSDFRLEKCDYNLVAEDEKVDDRLIQLLKQCDILQDENEKKLSIYF